MSEQEKVDVRRFVICDFETTSREAAEAHVVEWAALVVYPPWFDTPDREEHGGLVRPPIRIPAETSAIHHITDADVANAPTWKTQSVLLAELLGQVGTVAVAHNADYERTIIDNTPYMPTATWLCTYKSALRVWPDAPGHSNETLRYFLGHGTGRSQPQAAHSAAHDARVTAAILSELLKAATVYDMLRWTNEPALLPRCPIDDWRGAPWAAIESSFLIWIISKSATMRTDVVYCAQTELNRREAEAADKANANEIPF